VDALLAEYARTRDLTVRNELVLRHQPFVRGLAARFPTAGACSAEDLVQVGYLGLILAIDRYDQARGVAFLSFARPTIVGVLQHYLRDHSWLIRPSRRLREQAASLSRIRAALEQRLGRAAAPAELAQAAGVTEDRLLELMEAGQTYQVASLCPGYLREDGTDDTFEESIGAPDPEYSRVERGEIGRFILSQLPEREREIIVARFYLEQSQSMLGERLGISQIHVSRLERRALRRLRDWIACSVDHPEDLRSTGS
jgi:RNA polymerase sigma-B factor